MEAVEVTLRFPGHFVSTDTERFARAANEMLHDIGATISDGVTVEIDREEAILGFEVIGSDKIDVAFHLEELARTRSFALLGYAPDATTSRFIHRPSPRAEIASKILALEQRKISAEFETPLYRNMIFAIASVSAFLLASIFILLMIYRKKMRVRNPEKILPGDQRFLAYNKQPVYVISGLEKDDEEAQGINEKKEIQSALGPEA